MAVSERERRELLEALVGTIGPDPTDTLLGLLPPAGWADVATTRDLEALGAGLRGEIQRLDGKIDALTGRLDGKIDALAGRLDGKIDALNSDLTGKIDRLDAKVDNMGVRLEGQFHRELHKQDRWLMALTITIVLALFGQTLTLISLRFFG
jgi:hypothetical protein